MTTITEYLAEQKRLVGAATTGPWHIDSIESGEHALFIDEDNPEDGMLGAAGSTVASFLLGKNAEFIAAARESVPRLVAALEAVIEMHRPEKTLPPLGDKRLCAQETCEGFWPCQTICAIETALGATNE